VTPGDWFDQALIRPGLVVSMSDEFHACVLTEAGLMYVAWHDKPVQWMWHEDMSLDEWHAWRDKFLIE
jgi:hypothetical protein